MISEDQLRLTLLRYLTGKMTDDDRNRFEERLLIDQDFSDAAAVSEQELIDAYALESMNANEALSLRSWIEASQARMQRVEMARALLVRAPQKVHRKQYIAIILAAAACVLAAVGITLHLTRKSMQSSSRVVPPVAVATAVPSRNGTSQVSPDSAEKPKVILLIAERIRGPQQITTYQIPRDAPVQLQIVLKGAAAPSGYSLKIHPMDGKRHVFLERKDLKAQSVDGQLYVSAVFSPGSLPPATYSAFLSRGGETLVSAFAVRWQQ